MDGVFLNSIPEEDEMDMEISDAQGRPVVFISDSDSSMKGLERPISRAEHSSPRSALRLDLSQTTRTPNSRKRVAFDFEDQPEDILSSSISSLTDVVTFDPAASVSESESDADNIDKQMSHLLSKQLLAASKVAAMLESTCSVTDAKLNQQCSEISKLTDKVTALKSDLEESDHALTLAYIQIAVIKHSSDYFENSLSKANELIKKLTNQLENELTLT